MKRAQRERRAITETINRTGKDISKKPGSMAYGSDKNIVAAIKVVTPVANSKQWGDNGE